MIFILISVMRYKTILELKLKTETLNKGIYPVNKHFHYKNLHFILQCFFYEIVNNFLLALNINVRIKPKYFVLHFVTFSQIDTVCCHLVFAVYQFIDSSLTCFI